MGANAQTTVPSFTTGQVLTADQQNQSARTGVPVFATSVERDAAFGGSGEKTLAEGQLAYLEDSDIVQYYDGSVWATLAPQPAPTSGLVFVTGATFTAAAGFSLPNDTFTATYDNYKLIVDVTAISATALFTMRLRASGSDNTVANYNTMFFGGNSAGAAFSEGGNDLTAFNVLGCSTTFPIAAIDVDVISPFLARHTDLAGSIIGSTATVFASMGGGATFRGTTSFDSLSLIVAGGATITGNYRVYGYANS